MPWLKRLYPYGKWFGIGALAAPSATVAINKLKGYNPEKAMGIIPSDKLMTTITPRFARKYVNPSSSPFVQNNPTLERALRKLYSQPLQE